jgi:hypothetical protein
LAAATLIAAGRTGVSPNPVTDTVAPATTSTAPKETDGLVKNLGI